MGFVGCQHVGLVDRNKVRESVRAELPQFKKCYDSEFKKDATLSGQAVLLWEIHPGGVAQKVRFVEEKTDLKNEVMKQCLVSVMEKIKFDEPPNGAIVEVTYPFVFKNQKSGAQPE